MTLWLCLGIYLILINVATIAAWGYDKSCATAGARRIPESDLLLLSFLGGWPGGITAAHLFRHKTRKKAFIVRFVIVVAFEVVLVCAAILLLYCCAEFCEETGRAVFCRSAKACAVTF